MLNEQINKYKETYSTLVTAFAKLHNAHLSFVINKGRDTGFAVRKELRTIEQSAKDLKKLCQLVSKESIQNRRLEKKQRREEKLAQKSKKKKNVVDTPRNNS